MNKYAIIGNKKAAYAAFLQKYPSDLIPGWIPTRGQPLHQAVAAILLSLSFTALSQYCALNGLLMRKASGVTSTILSVGIFSSGSKASSASCASATTACFARSAWPACAERATEKNRSTGTEFCDRPSNQPHRGRCPAAARAFLCQNGRWSESAPAPPQTRAAGPICAQGP